MSEKPSSDGNSEAPTPGDDAPIEQQSGGRQARVESRLEFSIVGHAQDRDHEKESRDKDVIEGCQIHGLEAVPFGAHIPIA